MGKVFIIGAGPGDYKLLTIKAVECIQKADVIIYDRLINKNILKHAKKDAVFIYAGKSPKNHTLSQSEINSLLVRYAYDDKIVARVKGGDPFLFGRGGEEAEYLAENGVNFEIVPGVTSAIAVAAYAGIPVTHRNFCSSLHIIAGNKKDKDKKNHIDYKILSKIEGTIVFLMGLKNIKFIIRNLIKNGKDISSPCAIVVNGTTFNQKVVEGTIGDILEKVKVYNLNSPAVIIIGEVVKLRNKLNWFPFGKLAGKRIMVTRAKENSKEFIKKIEEIGGEVLEFPTIEIAEIDDYSEFDEVLTNIKTFNWIVFTSVNGVSTFFNRMKMKKIDLRSLSGLKIASIGKETTKKINDFGVLINFMPCEYTSEKLLEGLLRILNENEKVLLVRSNIANDILKNGLEKKGIKVKNLIAYKIVKSDINKEQFIDVLREGYLDFITFTSPSTVNNFVSILGKENITKLHNIKVVCIGPVTAKAARELGFKEILYPDVYTVDGIISKIKEIT